MFFYLFACIEQTLHAMVLNHKFCSKSIPWLSRMSIIAGCLLVITLQILMVKEVYTYIRINESYWYFLVAFVCMIPLVLSIRRYKYTTSQSFWFCLFSNVLIWVSLNGTGYQDILGDESLSVNVLVGTCSQMGHFLQMHGITMHLMFQKAICNLNN